jgi:TonB family protein
MASALASPPPPFSGGNSDLKANARKFLERALVISALVHLAGVGLFRAALERPIQDEEVADVPRWEDPAIITPPIHLMEGWHPSGSRTGGIYEPGPDDVRFPITRPWGVDPAGVAFDPRTGPEDPSSGPHNPPGPPQPASPGFTVAEVLPVPTYAPLPVYPDMAREVDVEGRVIVRVLVGTDGVPRRVIAVSGPKLLMGAAVEGVRRWRFKPATTNGSPVEVWVEIPIVFHF